MRVPFPFAGAVLAALAAVACGTRLTVVPNERSAAGESCDAQDDCATGLQCVDLVCRMPGTPSAGTAGGGGGGGGGAPASSATKSGLGESCNRRLDCMPGLLCLERACRAGDTPDAMQGPRKGGRGESCVASNDCQLGMGCVGASCRDRVLLVPRVANECHRVECVAADDCCKDFRPSDLQLCEELDQSCQAGVRSDCDLHASVCTCRQVCEDAICVAQVECASDLDCGGSGVLRCFAGKCAQCAADSDCNGVAACVSGLCRAGCNRNEECPLLSECKEHRCEHVGCRSDRECFFESGSPRSQCVERECRTPCESDVACTHPFSGCREGFCMFVGCDTDEECRGVLQLFDQPVGNPARAACRPPAE